ncbi:RecB family exonuclease [Bacillus phage v_B-Bak10]|uniref:RecB family exonuclease n=1 Tax=Bacillus phage v_B-Bak10 TaxID=2094736 RepID=A0A385IK05_9CAUD|nr:RecB family exonuclease [Bacillus phage v_B-Bak10]AXY83226.1 RecB family exonuclease [Bacillus phage v_B-Bak10]
MKYLSSSRLTLIDVCALSFKFDYIEGTNIVAPVTTWYGAFGKMCHDILDGIVKKEITAELFVISEYDRKFPSCEIPEDKRAEYYQKGKQGILERYHWLQQLKYEGRIIGSELEFTVGFDFTVPQLYGFIDLAYTNEYGKIVIRDYKSSKPFTPKKMSEQWQPYVYPLAYYLVTGVKPDIFEFDHFMHGETRTVIIDDVHLELAKAKIKMQWEKIKKSNYAATYNWFWCNNFCEYKHACPLFLSKHS